MFKKLTVLLLSAIMCCCGFVLTGCKKENEDGTVTVRLNEVARSVFYAPMYVAINNGYFSEYGITVKLETGSGADKVMSALASNSADVGLMGPEATVYAQAEGKKDYPIIFGQLTQKDGSFMVSKKDEKATFTWASLKGKHVIGGRAGGMPNMTLQYVLKNENIAISDLKVFDDQTQFALQGQVFAGNSDIDYTTLFEPAASMIEREGKGYVVAAVGDASGEVPFTSFSANKSYIENNKDLIINFIRAIIKGYHYVIDNAATPEKVATDVQSFFADTDLDLLTSSIRRYSEIDAWCETPEFLESSYIKLQDILENAGMISKRVEYTKAVDNTYVLAALSDTAA